MPWLMFLIVPVMIHGMSNRTKAEVGAMVKSRRLQLHLAPGDVVERADVDPKTYASLEDGTRWPQERTRLKIEAVLQWKPGSIADALLGHDPAETDPVPSSPSRDRADIDADRVFAALDSLSDSAANLLVRSDQPLQRVLESTQIQQAALDILNHVMASGPKPPADVERAYALWRRLRMADLVEQSNRFEPLKPPSWYSTKENDNVLEATTQSSTSTEAVKDEEVTSPDESQRDRLDEVSRLIIASAADVDQRNDGGQESG